MCRYRQMARVAYNELAILYFQNPIYLLNLTRLALAAPPHNDLACTLMPSGTCKVCGDRWHVVGNGCFSCDDGAGMECVRVQNFIIAATNLAGQEFERMGQPTWGSIHQAVFAHAIFNATQFGCLANR